MPRIIPKELVSVAVYIPRDNQEVELPLDASNFEEDGFIEFDDIYDSDYEKQLRIAKDRGTNKHHLEISQKLMIQVPLDEKAEQLQKCYMSSKEIGISFVIAQIEGTVHISVVEVGYDYELGRVMRFTFEW